MSTAKPRRPNLRIASEKSAPAPADASDQASRFATLLGHLGRNLTLAYDRRMPLTRGQSEILGRLSEQDGQTQTELAAGMGIHKVSVGAHIEGLERLGLIERRPHPTDRRAKCIYLTEHFHRVKGYGINIFRMIHDHALQGISEKDYETALRVLERMDANLQTLGSKDVPVEKPE